VKLYLALDVGEKRIGVAQSDELGMFAHARETIYCGKRQEFQDLTRVIGELKPAAIVVGYPLEMSGKKGPRVQLVEKFCDRLKGYLSSDPDLRKLEFIFWDERLTSVEAERALRGKSPSERKAMTDSVAAVIILESYLSSLP